MKGFLRQYADTSSPGLSFSPPRSTLKLSGLLDINVFLKVPFDPDKVKPHHPTPRQVQTEFQVEAFVENCLCCQRPKEPEGGRVNQLKAHKLCQTKVIRH